MISCEFYENVTRVSITILQFEYIEDEKIINDTVDID